MIGAYIRGVKRIRFERERRSEVFDLAFRLGIRVWGERERGGTIEIRAAAFDGDRLAAEMEARGMAASLTEPEGLPAFLRFCVRRPGIVLGCLLTAVWMLWSSGLVWDVRIEGNRNVPPERIFGYLEDEGFGIGTRFRGIDFDQMIADILAAQNELAWLSVYMDGTVARVQVWEMRGESPREHPAGVYANVVAAEDGVIEEVNVREGMAAVKAGDVIRAGEAAISGTVEKKDGGVRFEYADGEVLATTVRALRAEVPFTRTEYRPTGEEKRSFFLKIFKKSVKLFENSGFDGGYCDKINTIGRVCLFGRISLPVWIGSTLIRRTEPVTVTLTRGEAEAEALAQLRGMIREAAEGGELAGRQVRVSFTDDACVADAVLYVTRDIGRTVEFSAPAADSPGGGQFRRIKEKVF